jgi:hypothetical protein
MKQMEDRTPLAELRRDFIAAAVMLFVVGLGAWVFVEVLR